MSKKAFIMITGMLSLPFWTWLFYPSEADLLLSEGRKLKEKKPDQVIFDGFLEPDYPRESDNKTLYGVDSNKNGVRDDVEIWINRNLHTYNERMIARQYAADTQYALKAAVINTSEGLGHAASVSFTSARCVIFILGSDKGQRLMNNLEMMTYNTKNRKEILKNFMYSTYAVKSVVEGMYVNEGYKACNFKVENEVELKRKYLEL